MVHYVVIHTISFCVCCNFELGGWLAARSSRSPCIAIQKPPFPQARREFSFEHLTGMLRCLKGILYVSAIEGSDAAPASVELRQ